VLRSGEAPGGAVPALRWTVDPRSTPRTRAASSPTRECEYLLAASSPATRSQSGKLGSSEQAIPTVLRDINDGSRWAPPRHPQGDHAVVFHRDWSMPSREAEAANALLDQWNGRSSRATWIARGLSSRRPPRRGDAIGTIAIRPPWPTSLSHRRRMELGNVYQRFVGTSLRAETSEHGSRCLKRWVVNFSPFGPKVSEAARRHVGESSDDAVERPLHLQGPLKDNEGAWCYFRNLSPSDRPEDWRAWTTLPGGARSTG